MNFCWNPAFVFSVDQIKDVVTIEEAVNRKPGMTSDYAIIYGVITSFDLDSENTERFFRTRWFVSFSLWQFMRYPIYDLLFIPPANFVCGGYTPRKLCLWWVYCFHIVRACVRLSITFCFLNILKSHC